jgi:hypothetical protein
MDVAEYFHQGPPSETEFVNVKGAQELIPSSASLCSPGGIDSLESNPGLLKCLQIRALQGKDWGGGDGGGRCRFLGYLRN